MTKKTHSPDVAIDPRALALYERTLHDYGRFRALVDSVIRTGDDRSQTDLDTKAFAFLEALDDVLLVNHIWKVGFLLGVEAAMTQCPCCAPARVALAQIQEAARTVDHRRDAANDRTPAHLLGSVAAIAERALEREGGTREGNEEGGAA